MNKQQMINDAKLHIHRAAVVALLGDKIAYLESYAIAQYLIDKLERLFDYDFIDDNEDYANDYSYIVEAHKLYA